MFKKNVAKLLLKMIEDFIDEKRREGKNPTLKLMVEELKIYLKK